MVHFRKILSVIGLVGLLLGWSLSPPAVRGQTAAPLDVAALDTFLQEQVAAQHLPGLAIAVVQGEQVVLVRGYGEAAPGIPVTPQTQFYLGSLTKSFTALAVMQLVEQGRLELDAPVQRYLPWFAVADVEASAQITVRHLLNHTSGLSEANDPTTTRYMPTLEAQVRSLRDAPLTAPVGRRYQYDSQNYRTLGLLIEQVSGQSYGDYMREHICAPLGMTHTVADPADAAVLAQGYGMAFGAALPRPQAFRPGALPSGYLIASAEDMAHYLIALLNEGRYGNQAVVAPETLAQMFTPPADVESEYGMGWAITRSEDGYRLIYHGGSLENFHTMGILLPDQHTGFVLLFNQNSLRQMFTSFDPIILGVANLLVGDPAPAPPTWDWLNGVLIGVGLFSVGVPLILFWRLPRWAARTARWPRGLQWAVALGTLLLPVAVVVGVPLIPRLLFNDGGGWSELYGLAPDIALCAGAFLGLFALRGVAQFVIVAGRPAR